MEIDNFKTIRKHLVFKTDFDRYIVHVMKRAKDDNGKEYGCNETNRLLKTFYITSLEYFDKKIPVIKDLCKSNNARAYILPQVRDNSSCLKELLKIVVDNLDNPTIKPDHLIRSAYCGYHGSRDKKWILDLDNDNMTEYFSNSKLVKKEWTPRKVLKLVQDALVSVGKHKDEAYLLPTKNGNCLVTSTFDLKSAFEKCSMLFEDDKHILLEPSILDENTINMNYVKRTGWLHKDGMALLYYNIA